MLRRLWLALAGLALVLAAGAETVTIYKYRAADGRIVYSNRPLQGAELLEAFSYDFPAPSSAEPAAPKHRAEVQERIRARLLALEEAWKEVQEASRALAAAEEKRLASVEPREGEQRARRDAAQFAPPAAGGPLAPAHPQAGGPLDGRRGGGLRPEYEERQRALEAEVAAARERLEAAWRRYNALR